LITYRVRLDVPRELILFVSRLLARHRTEIGTRKGTRCLGCYRQALFVLAWYRDKTDIPRLGAGFGLSQATSYRYVAEGTRVVSAEAPGLEEALERAVKEGTPYVILDGKIVAAADGGAAAVLADALWRTWVEVMLACPSRSCTSSSVPPASKTFEANV